MQDFLPVSAAEAPRDARAIFEIGLVVRLGGVRAPSIPVRNLPYIYSPRNVRLRTKSPNKRRRAFQAPERYWYTPWPLVLSPGYRF